MREIGLQTGGVLWAGLLTEVIEALPLRPSAIAVAPSAPMLLLEILSDVMEALAAMAGANVAATSGPRLLPYKQSCAQDTRDRGGHRRSGQGGWEPWVEVHAGV